MDEKLSLYSYIIYHIDKMGFKADAIKKHVRAQTDTQDFFPGKEFDEIVNDVNAVIKNKYYLFKQSFFKEWVYVSVLHYDPTSKTHLIELRQTLIKEYNDTIIPEYKEITGVDIPKIT